MRLSPYEHIVGLARHHQERKQAASAERRRAEEVAAVVLGMVLEQFIFGNGRGRKFATNLLDRAQQAEADGRAIKSRVLTEAGEALQNPQVAHMLGAAVAGGALTAVGYVHEQAGAARNDDADDRAKSGTTGRAGGLLSEIA